MEYWKVDYTGTFGDTANYQLAEIWEPGVLGFGCVWFPPYPGAGSGVLAKVIFNVSASAPNGDTVLDIGTYGESPTVYTGTDGQSRYPEITDGILTITGGVEPNDPPYTPSNPNPIDTAVDVPVNPTFTWDGGDPNDDPVSYEVYLGTSSPPVHQTTVTTESYTPDILDTETLYYWQIIADDGQEESPGPIWSFTTGVQPPNDPPCIPSNPEPMDGAVDVYPEIEFSWDGGDPNEDDIVTYAFAYGTSPDEVHPIALTLPYPATQTRITFGLDVQLEYNTQYYWQITAMDNWQAQSVSPLWTFTTGDNNPPGVPAQPQGGASASHCLEYRYTTSSIDPEGDLVRYYWEWGDGSAGEWSDWYPSGQLCSMNHVWDTIGSFDVQVKAEDDAGAESGWSEPLLVSVTNNPPFRLWNPQPEDTATNVSIDTTLEFLAGDINPCDTVTYGIYFGTDMEPPLIDTIGPYPANQGLISYDPGTLIGETTYYWKVRAEDNYGASTEGPVWSFTTEPLYDLTVDVIGSGEVDVFPEGPYIGDTEVTLTANPGTGWRFDSWSGDITGSENPATLVIDADTFVTATFVKLTPDLDGSGDLSWTDIEPGATVDGSITVENVGEATSMLSWEVESYPDWGTWTFTPDSGDSLTPEAGSITIDVEVVAPDEQNQDFEGTVKIVNTEDSSDYFEVSVTLSTPRARNTFQLWIYQIFTLLVQRFPLLELIFGQYF